MWAPYAPTTTPSQMKTSLKSARARCKTCPFIRNVDKISGHKRSIIHLYLSQCHLLHNLHSLQKVIHRRNREKTRRPIPRTPSTTNLFCCRYQAPTNSVAPSFCIYKPHTTHNSSIRSDEGITFETSAFESL